MQKYLGSGLVKGIGPVFARRIVDTFGEATFDVIDTTAERLTEVAGIGPVRAQRIAATWEEQRQIREVMTILQSYAVSTSLAVRIYKRFGDNRSRCWPPSPTAWRVRSGVSASRRPTRSPAQLGWHLTHRHGWRPVCCTPLERRLRMAIRCSLKRRSRRGSDAPRGGPRRGRWRDCDAPRSGDLMQASRIVPSDRTDSGVRPLTDAIPSRPSGDWR